MTLHLIDLLQRWISTPPDDGEFVPDLAIEPPPPGLDDLVQRTVRALGDYVDVSAEDIEIILFEGLWQLAHGVRQGRRVILPELGELERVRGEVHFTADPGLLEDAHG